MNKEMNESAPYCGLPNGLEDKSSYLQKFVCAPKSDYPMKASSQGKAVPKHEIMSMCMGK